MNIKLLKQKAKKPAEIDTKPPEHREQQQGTQDYLCEYCGKFNGFVYYSARLRLWVCPNCFEQGHESNKCGGSPHISEHPIRREPGTKAGNARTKG